LDAEFLHLENGVTPMHIAGVCVFEGPVPPIEDLTELVAGKLHLIPRYRQRVRSLPLEIGRPVWVDDPHFNIRYHLRHTALPAPGDDAALCRLMGRLMSQPLDLHRPLWEAWIVEGLSDGQWALIFKVHHCMVDGISGVDLLTVMLDIDRDVEPLEPQPWAPSPDPSIPALVFGAWSGLAGDLVRIAGRLPRAARSPVDALRSAWHGAQGALAFGRKLGTTPALSIEGTIGPHRVWAHSSASLDDVRVIRGAFGGTVNDVVLAACAGGYRALLQHRGENPDNAVVRSLVPVSLRTPDARGEVDNRVSGMLYELPVQVADPVERLRLVHDEMATLKHSHMAEAGEWVTAAGDLAPPMMVGMVTRAAMRVMQRMPQRSVNTVTTNVPGPQFPLYCLGREMLAYYPYVPLSVGVRVGTAILSYNGQLTFGVTGDFDTAPDVEVLARAIGDGVTELMGRTTTTIDLVELEQADATGSEAIDQKPPWA
jgi:WS/DGAT/MGAT family acyltransferase